MPYLGGAIPPFAHIETKTDMGFVGSGIAVAGAPYFISLLYALGTCGAQMDCRSGSAFLYIPVVGPFITAGQSLTTGGAALAAFDGSLQTLGAALVIAGIVNPKRFVVWQDRSAAIAVTPTALGSGAGAGAGLALTLSHM